MIKLDHVSVEYDGVSITYKDHTFRRNNITFLEGPNGSGKTTLLKAIANLNQYKGSISYSGNATYNSQKPTLFNRTLLDNILYPVVIRNWDIETYKAIALEFADKLNLTHLLSENALTLSDGEKMKGSIIRSIIFHPDIVLLDEPTTSLDVQSIQELTLLLKELKKDITFIISSHDRFFINELKDDVYQIGATNVQRKNT